MDTTNLSTDILGSMSASVMEIHRLDVTSLVCYFFARVFSISKLKLESATCQDG